MMWKDLRKKSVKITELFTQSTAVNKNGFLGFWFLHTKSTAPWIFTSGLTQPNKQPRPVVNGCLYTLSTRLINTNNLYKGFIL